MTFATIIKFVDFGFQINDTSSTPQKMIDILKSQIDALNKEASIINSALNTLDLNTLDGKLELSKKIKDFMDFKITFGDSEFRAVSIVGEHARTKKITLIPSEFESDVGVKMSSKNVKISGAYFETPVVDIKCTGDIYIENVDFGDAKVSINNRKLTAAEVKHISSDKISICPIEKELILDVDTSDFLSEDAIKEMALSQSGDELKLSLLERLGDLDTEIVKKLFDISELSGFLDVCGSEYNKVIDISCSAIDDFDFMAV